jgi:hypothetical protein
MGVQEIRDAWNGVAPDYPIQKAIVFYNRDASGVQWQLITFYGMTPVGERFEVTTDPHDMNSDPRAVAADMALKFVEAAKADVASGTATPQEKT